MKISCPKCNASGTIPDHEIPESGRFLNCPRCNESFTVTRPKAGKDEYLVDTCPSCSFSTFGDETFGTCPKCGIAIKVFVERQREELMLKRNQELLEKKLNNVETAPLPPAAAKYSVSDFIDNLHPVNLISWGVAAVAIIVLGFGLFGIVGYDSEKIQAMLLEKREEKASGLYIFFHYGLSYWVMLLYGISAMAISFMFMKKLKKALIAMSYLLWTTIALVSLSYITGFVSWVMAPVPHTISGYLVEIFNAIFMTALICVPIHILEQYLQERKITSVVKL